MTARKRARREHADVVVIGGGPAGSTAATMLARTGHRVVLLERERFPRAHVGESLLPASVPILEELGVRDAIEAEGFLPKYGATMVWGSGPEPWSWYFRETNARYPHSYQVWRPRFDQLLLDRSRDQGVDVREGHQAVEALFEGERAAGVRFRSDGGDGELAANFVVDASGQNGLLARSLGTREWDSFFRNLAVYAYFEGAARLPEPDATNIFIEAYEHGWFWNIPLSDGRMSVGAVMDSATGQRLIADFGVQACLDQQIAAATNTCRMLRHARQVDGPFVVKDWSYSTSRFVGDGYILAGDAACFVDPLFSSGVHLALSSGVLAAAYVTSALRDTELREAAASAYRELYEGQYLNFHRMAQLFYSSNRTADSYFWEARRLTEAAEGFSPRHAFIRAVAGQSPLGYERAVLARGDAPPAFAAGVRAVEAEHAARRAQLERARSGALADAVPVLAPDVRVARKPVVGRGEFEWGYVFTSDARPEGAPVSPLVARLVSTIDSVTPVSGLLARLGDELPPDVPAPQREQLLRGLLDAVRILYVDGTIDELRGL